jgi:D-xylose transport system permease protein
MAFDEPPSSTEVGSDDRLVSVVEREEISDEAASQATLAVAPELVANSLGEYVRVWLTRVRGGESGVLPVVGGLLLISILFQSLNSKFLTAGNLVNLLVQGSPYMLLAMGEIFALLLGEIDLSIGFVSGIGGIIAAELVKQSYGWPWWAAIIVALVACAAIGTLQGTIITRVGLPSFVVTLAGLLGWQGVMLLMLGKGGALPINDKVINDLTSGNLTVIGGWIVMLVVVALFGLHTWLRDSRRRASGLVAPPASLTLLKIGAVLVAGVVVVVICNTNRGTLVPIRGVPWVVLIVLAVLAAYTTLLGRTRFGRYMYAIGGNPEGARRAGVKLPSIRTTAFALASFTAGIAGVVYASRLRSVSTALDGGTLVLYAVAAAVIGGTSLFGGRGKAVHGVLGGLVIAAIDNGMGLQGYSAAAKYVVTAIVLLLAVTIDALARRGRTTGR